MRDEIEEQIDLMVGDGSGPFEKLKCPNCQKPAIAESTIITEHANEMAKLTKTDKIPKTKRIRHKVKCRYCGYVCSDREKLKDDGIEPEIEIS